MSILRNRVQQFRELYGISREELAQQIDISIETLKRIEEQEGYMPQMRTAVAICDRFQTEIERVFWIDRSMDAPSSAEERNA